MNLCPKWDTCFLVLKVDLMPVLKQTIEKKYCNKSFEKCARYKLEEAGIPVPNTLLPNEKICVQCQVRE